jgi:hypothetical protein
VTGPNGQPSYEQMILQRRDTSRRMREASTLLLDTADRLSTTGPYPGLAQQIYDAALDLENLARTVALLERQADTRDNEPEET